MLNLNVLLTENLRGFSIVVLHTPGHVRVLFHNFGDHLLLSIMEVGEAGFGVIRLSLGGEWRKIWVAQELLEVAELVLFDLACVHIVLILLSKHVLLIVSLEEWVDSINLLLLEHLWKIKHHHFLVWLGVHIKHLLQDDLNRLVAVELHSKSEGRHKVEVDLNDQILLTELYLKVVVESAVIVVGHLMDE